MHRALSQLAHNGRIVANAEKALNSMLDGSINCYLYIVNPDGTRVRLQHGFKIENYEFVGMNYVEEEIE